MVQYLINCTAIWLTGLIIFDVFLRREKYHSYNRFYLLSILVVGTLLPLWEWQPDSVIYSAGISQPIAEQATVIKSNIAGGADNGISISVIQILWAIYITGAVLVFLFFLKEARNIYLLYKKTTKSRIGRYTLVETGESHSPFSLLNMVFLGAKKVYTKKELQIIITHELQHIKRVHFADLLFSRVLNVLFWFHPLVYILQKRLFIVHEYEADSAVSAQPEEYGKFLAEQSMLASAPVFSHTFIRSPLKKRILMLTRKTSRIAGIKKLVAIPVLFIALLLGTKTAFSGDEIKREGNFITYKGNVFEFPPDGEPDTVYVEDPATGEIQLMITKREGTPKSMNGEKIYNPRELNASGTNKLSFSAGALKTYILTQMENQLRKLPDGDYRLRIADIVLSKDGKVVLFTYEGMQKVTSYSKFGDPITEPIDEDINSEIARKASSLIDDMPLYEPAKLNGKKVHSNISDTAFWNTFTIKNGRAVKM